MTRSDSRNLRSVPRLRHESRLLQCWLDRRLKQTAPTASQGVHSCLSSSAHPPNTPLLSELATEGQQHQPHQWANRPQKDVHDHAPQGDYSWFPPLLLQCILTQRISVEIQHAAPRCFETHALTTGKMTTPLKMPQQFMMPMCYHREIVAAHQTVKMAWQFGSVWWSCHEQPAQLSCPVHLLHAEVFLGKNLAAPFAGVCLISAGVPLISPGVWRLYFLLILQWPLFQPLQHFIQFCQHKDVHCTPNTNTVEPNRGKKN